MKHPLANVGVVNLQPGLAAAYCARLLADLGCHVTNVDADPDEQSPRSWHFDLDAVPDVCDYLQMGQRRLSGREAQSLSDIVSVADVVIDSGALSAGDIEELQRTRPTLSGVRAAVRTRRPRG